MGIDDVGYRPLNDYSNEYAFILYGKNYKFVFQLKGNQLIEIG